MFYSIPEIYVKTDPHVLLVSNCLVYRSDSGNVSHVGVDI